MGSLVFISHVNIQKHQSCQNAAFEITLSQTLQSEDVSQMEDLITQVDPLYFYVEYIMAVVK